MMDTPKAIALNRFGLGGRPGDSAGSDPRAWVLAQLSRFDPLPAPIAALPSRAALIADLGDYRAMQAQQRKARTTEADAAAMPPMATDAGDTSRKDLRRAYVEAAHARVVSAVQSEAPFPERLVHFWSNHFAISADKLLVTPLAGNYEFEAIRPHVLGNFADLLTAAVTHPAMMLYLDQAQSIGPNSPLASRAARRGNRKLGLNENLAREIMELHTLGVRTGYSQADVTEFARALTGWTVAGLGQGPGARLAQGKPGEAVFAAALHEPGARMILGRTYAEGGAGQARAVLGDLAASPATAHHVATKLARHFIADDPPAAAVARVETAFLQSGGDLPTIYRALVEAPESWTQASAKFRSPWDWTVAALRATGGRIPPNPQATGNMLQQLGQPAWRPGSPAGWGDTSADWAGPGALLTRVELAQQIAARVGDRIDARALAPVVLADALTPETAEAIGRSEQPALGLALLLSSPEFMRR